MELDRPRREEQLGGDLLVREAFGDQASDLELLRGQLVDGARVALPRSLTCGLQLGPRTLGPRLGAESLEGLERESKMHARLGPLASPPQMLAEQKLGPSL